MTVLATVYAPIQFFPEVADLEPFVPGTVIEVDGKAQRATVAWPELTVTLTRVPNEAMGGHLVGLQKHVREKGGGEALAIRVLSTLSVYELTAEPGIDPEQRAMGFVVSIVQATMGLCLLDGDVLDERGRSLIEIPLRPPAQKRVAARCLALLAAAMRGLIEEDAGKPDEEEAEKFRRRLVEYTASIPELSAELEPAEQEFLRTPIGQANEETVIDAVWRAEGAQVLLWALNERQLPAHDAQEHPFVLCKAVGLLQQERPVILSSELRTAEDLEWMRLRLLALHWRMVEARMNPAKKVEFARLSEREFLPKVDLSDIAIVDGDLGFEGESITAIDQRQIQIGQSIARERHHAANWLLGVHPVYSNVITPT